MPLHPMLIHFPIALIVVAVLLDWGRWIFSRQRLLVADFWGGSTPLLLLALLSAIASVVTGLLAEEGVVQTAIIHELIEAHEMAAFITTGLLAVLALWRLSLRGRFPQKSSFLYLVLLIATMVSVGYGAYFGGEMVYMQGVGVNPGF